MNEDVRVEEAIYAFTVGLTHEGDIIIASNAETADFRVSRPAKNDDIRFLCGAVSKVLDEQTLSRLMVDTVPTPSNRLKERAKSLGLVN